MNILWESLAETTGTVWSMFFPSSASSSANQEWRRTFETIKAGHDEAYATIERAIKFEEHERPDLALQAYKDGIRRIDETLALPVEVPDLELQGPGADESWKQAVAMIHKMKRTRGEVLQRIGQLGGGEPASEGDTNGSASVGQRPWTYTELAMALREMADEQREMDERNALELLFSCDGVQMYYIEPDGVVSRTMADSTLRFVRIEGDERRQLQPTVFLQVIETRSATRIENAEEPLVEEPTEGQQTAENANAQEGAREVEEEAMERESEQSQPGFLLYPLIPGVSPCYRTEYGAFILPDLADGSVQGRAIGLVVPPGADEVVLEILVAFLHGVVTQPAPADGVRVRKRSLLPDSTTVSAGIIKGAFYLSQGLVRGAERTGQLIATSTPYVISKLGQKQSATNAGEAAGDDATRVQVPKNVRTGIEIAKSVTGTAAGVTSYVAGKVGTATMALGRFLAPHIQRHGSALLAYGTGMSEQAASERMNGALTICAGAVEGFGTVYEGLERSATILGHSLSASTVQIVEHRYGTEAGRVVGSSLDTVGNVINVTHNMNYMTPKGLAKRTAKNAGKALVAGYRPPVPEVDGGAGTSSAVVLGETTREQRTTVPAAVLYPDLEGLAKEMRPKE